jgi:hypothetical protein
LSFGSWGNTLDRLSLGDWKDLNWELNLRSLELSLRLRLSFDWLNLGASWRLSSRFSWRLGERLRRRDLRLNLKLSLRLERLRQGRGLNRLDLNGLLSEGR